MDDTDKTHAARSLPFLTVDNRDFWTGGANNRLLIFRCNSCAYYVHPPTTFCPRCESRDVGAQPVSGFGTIFSFTMNYKKWFPGLDVPYIIAFVVLEEQDDVRLVSNIVDCNPDDVRIGQRVKVRFEQASDIWVPLFAPVSDLS